MNMIRMVQNKHIRDKAYTNSCNKEVILLSDIDHLCDLGRELGEGD